MSNALTTPSKAESVKICQSRISPQSAKKARPNAKIIEAVCVPITTLRRSTASATLPPIGEKRKTGIWPAKAIAPNKTAEPVRR